MEIVSFLRSWVIDIVIMFIFITALQMMLPSNSMKKYIDVIVGFLIIFVVINPFVKILSGNINLEQNFLKKYKENISWNYDEDENFLNSHNQQMIKLYEENLEEKIKETVKLETGYEITDINLTIIDNTDDSNYGELVGIALTINPNKKIESEKVGDNSIKINEIKISDDRKKKVSGSDFKDDGKIRKVISKNYDVSKENIEIFFK